MSQAVIFKLNSGRRRESAVKPIQFVELGVDVTQSTVQFETAVWWHALLRQLDQFEQLCVHQLVWFVSSSFVTFHIQCTFSSRPSTTSHCSRGACVELVVKFQLPQRSLHAHVHAV